MAEAASAGAGHAVRGFLRGVCYPPTASVPYPRADFGDPARLPLDVFKRAEVPVGVRLEAVGRADVLEIEYETLTGDLGVRGQGGGIAFSVWDDVGCIATAPAEVGRSSVRLSIAGARSTRLWVYLPEAMKPRVVDIRTVGGTLVPPPAEPAWLAYGDSITEGFNASEPARSWPAIAGRRFGLDVRNLGFAGAARGEIAMAEQLASLRADVISIAFGTNCWGFLPFSSAMMASAVEGFLEVVRQGHPTTPILWVSPLVRPGAESKKNRLRATLAELRDQQESVVRCRIADGDQSLCLVGGANMVSPQHLSDGIHPDDFAHELLARVLGAAVASAVESATVPASG